MRATISVLVAILMAPCSSANSNEPNRLPNVTTILVEKAKRNMHLMAGGRIIRSYCIALENNPVGPKQFEGDGRTPEGRYMIDGRNPQSAFHRALLVSYPSPSDIERASALGKRPGGDIMIHGLRNGFGWIGRLHLLCAPSFVLEDDLAEPKMAEDIYRYFGMQPYWRKEGTEK